MDRRKITEKIMAFILGSAMILQGGFVMPAFADTEYLYTFHYTEGDFVSDRQNGDTSAEDFLHHAAIIPDDNDVNFYRIWGSMDTGRWITTEQGKITNWGVEPYRVIGYTFDGWYPHKWSSSSDTRRYTELKVMKDTVITDAVYGGGMSNLAGYQQIDLYANWEKYRSPYIETMQVKAFNQSRDKLPDIVITDKDGHAFSSGAVDETMEKNLADHNLTDEERTARNTWEDEHYYADVFGNNKYIALNFRAYEPDSDISITVNGNEVPRTKTDVIGTGYIWNGIIEKLENSVVTGTDYTTDDFAIELPEKSETTVKITVTLPRVEYDDNNGNTIHVDYQATKNYYIHINRLAVEIAPEYGNTVFGQIMHDAETKGLDEDQTEALREQFLNDHTYTYDNKTRVYSEKAWNRNDTLTTKVVTGAIPDISRSEYLNYDEDDTAIVVYSGTDFVDPGVKLYDAVGNTVPLSTTAITRKVNFPDVQTKLLNDENDENRNIINVPNSVKAGVYSIEYSAVVEGTTISAKRNVIVLPKPGDLNYDGYINSLDVNEFNKVYENTDSDSILQYRSMDLDFDGDVDEEDKSILRQRKSDIQGFYRDLSVQVTDATPTIYSDTSTGKAELYLDYLGKETTPAASKVTQDSSDEEDDLKQNDVMWLGFRLKDIANAPNFVNGIYSMTLALDYDQRYLIPYGDWIDEIKANNSQLNGYTFEGGITTRSIKSEQDKTTASFDASYWDDESQIRTVIMDIYNTSGELTTISDNEYIIKIPFLIKTVPINNTLHIVAAHLSANHLNFGFGNGGNTAHEMWDTSCTGNQINGTDTVCMNSHIKYVDNLSLEFGQDNTFYDLTETEPCIYGKSIIIGRPNAFNGGKISDPENLPPGMTYEASSNRIYGTPEKVGTYTFIIDGKRFGITVDPNKIDVIPNDIEKIYGDDFTLSFDYGNTQFNDDINDIVETAPTPSTDATIYTPVGSEEDITVSGGTISATNDYNKNYKFDYKTATLKVTQKRKIKITNLYIPTLTSSDLQKGVRELTYTASSKGGETGFTAVCADGGGTGDAVLPNDEVKLTYKVTYPDDLTYSTTGTTSAQVTISDLTIDTSSGKNYEIENYPTSATGVAGQKQIIFITAQLSAAGQSYEYGQLFDTNTLSVKIHYSVTDLRDAVTISFSQIDAYGIKATFMKNDPGTNNYVDSGIEVKDQYQLDVKNFSRFQVRFASKDNSFSPAGTAPITVNKKKLTVKPDTIHRTYGDENSVLDGLYTYKVKTSELVSWDNPSNVADEWAAPSTFAKLTGVTDPTMSIDGSVTSASDATSSTVKYDDKVLITDGSADNYYFAYEPGELVIDKRPLTVTSIDDSVIPVLKYSDWNGNLDGPKWYSNGTAAYAKDDDENNTMSVSNLAFDTDKVKINFRAEYDTKTPTVGLSTVPIHTVKADDPGMVLDDSSYPDSKNYYVYSLPSEAKDCGRVYGNEMVKSIVVNNDKLTTEYLYGEKIKLTESDTITISYDNGTSVNTSLDKIESGYGVTVRYKGTDIVPTENDMHGVKDKKVIVLQYVGNTEYADAKKPIEIPITVNPRRLHVSITGTTKSVYGNPTPTDWTLVYDENEFLTGEWYADASDRTDNLAGWNEPVIVCEDGRGNAVSSKTNRGSYPIKITGGEADNYVFVDEDGKSLFTNLTLVIEPRPINITDIKNIPVLTSDKVYDYKVAKAKGDADYNKHIEFTVTDEQLTDPVPVTPSESTYLVYSGVTNGDSPSISYTLRYDTVEAGQNKSVSMVSYTFPNTGDNYNYYINTFNSNVTTGEVLDELLETVEVTTEPYTEDEHSNKTYEDKYTYGETLDLSRYKVTFHYNSGRVAEEEVSFDNLPAGMTVSYYYDDAVREAAAGTDLVMPAVHTGRKLAVSYTGYDPETKTMAAKTAVTQSEIKVAKRLMHVTVDPSTAVYGEIPTYSYKYTEADYADIDKSDKEEALNFKDGLVAPVLKATDDTTGDEAVAGSDITDADTTYTIAVINKEEAKESVNYVFNYDDTDVLTITKRPLQIKSIENIPTTLKREDIVRDPDTGEYITSTRFDMTASNTADPITLTVDGIDGDDKSGIVTKNGVKDTIEIKYTAVYNTTVGTDNAEITIEYPSDWLNTVDHPEALNYEIADTKPTKATGTVEEQILTGIEIIENLPEENRTYNYGETFRLSGGKVKIIYDNDERDERCDFVSFENLKDYGISLTYTKNGDNVINDGRITVAKHNGSRIKITVDAKPSITATTDANEPITVAKHKMKIILEPDTFVYGNTPPDIRNNYHYDASDLVNGDSLDGTDFKSGLVAPTVYCNDGMFAVTRLSKVGTYVINGMNAASDNYEFETYIPADMTITRRPVVVTAIINGIPTLTSDIISREDGSVHKLQGTGATDTSDRRITVNNMLVNDSIGISYTAVYNTNDYGTDVPVDIENIKIDDTYGEGANYKLDDVTPSVTTAKGIVKDKEITAVTIEQEPKLEYTYGELLNLNGGRVKIDYDDNTTSYYKFNELPDKVSLVYSDLSRAADNDMLNVTFHDGKSLMIRTTSPYSVDPQTTKNKLIVHKKKLNIRANSLTVTYGDAVNLTWDYDESDFISNSKVTETKTSASFKNGLVEPVATCVDRSGTRVGSTTDIGTYEIRVSGGGAANYDFVYNFGTLTIEERPIDITAINSGIPMLTAKFKHENGQSPYRIPTSAVNENGQISARNIVNNDKIKVNFITSYTSVLPAENVIVNIEDMQLDKSYEKSKNYKLSYTVKNSNRGFINARNIEYMAIDTMPKIIYSYGDILNLSNGKVKLTYDDESVEIVSFDDLKSYDVALKYSETGLEAATGDNLTIDEHNEQRIILSATNTIYTVNDISTGPLTVEQRELIYDNSNITVEPITYDGDTTLTQGHLVFTNTAYDEVPTATGTFNFEDTQAGENKRVYITDINLDKEWTHNYKLPETPGSTTVTGTINKSATSVDNIKADDIKYEFTTDTNKLIVTVPDIPEKMLEGGAEYEYSNDGGETWQKSNEFEDIELGKTYDVVVRFAETDNYIVSEPSIVKKATAHANKLTLISYDKPAEEDAERPVLKVLFHDEPEADKEETLRTIIGDTEVVYYTMYKSVEGSSLSYPLDLSGDVEVYATLIEPRRRSSGGGGGGGGGGSSLVLKYENEDGTEGSRVPSSVELTTDTETITLIGSTDATNAELVWKSDNDSVATVENGVVTIHNKGRAVISVYAKNNKALSDYVTLIVSQGTGVKPNSTPTPTPKPTETPTHTDSPDKNMNIPYMTGYEGKIDPDDYMTRAEAATIMVKLAGEKNGDYKNIFPDVKEDAWYAKIVAEAAGRGFIAGFDDGNFYPEESVTREQFTAMVVRLVGLKEIEGSSFIDVEPNRWSAGSIKGAAESGVVAGYEDGTFRPEMPVKRSEAARIANVATNRIYDKDYLATIPCPFSDISSNHWAYYEFISASVEFEIP